MSFKSNTNRNKFIKVMLKNFMHVNYIQNKYFKKNEFTSVLRIKIFGLNFLIHTKIYYSISFSNVYRIWIYP